MAVLLCAGEVSAGASWRATDAFVRGLAILIAVLSIISLFHPLDGSVHVAVSAMALLGGGVPGIRRWHDRIRFTEWLRPRGVVCAGALFTVSVALAVLPVLVVSMNSALLTLL